MVGASRQTQLKLSVLFRTNAILCVLLLLNITIKEIIRVKPADKKQLFKGSVKSQIILRLKAVMLAAEHLRCSDAISSVGQVFIPFKDPPPTLLAGRAPGASCGSCSPPVRADTALDKT